MANLNKTKRRISSINYTKKITSAMELVSTIKLKRYKNVLFSYDEYDNEISSLILNILKGNKNKDIENKYLSEKKADKELIIIISSNLGLCASFNNDILKYVEQNISKEDKELLLIGNKAYRPLSNLGYEINADYIYLNEKIDFSEIRNFSNKIYDDFLNGKYKNIKVLYTKFINSIKFVPTLIEVLPLKKTNEEDDYFTYPPIYDVTPEKMLSELLPLYVTSKMYHLVIESQVSEQASRRNAMEAATDNADELLDKLTIEYNKARQASITQEITEVISSTLK